MCSLGWEALDRGGQGIPQFWRRDQAPGFVQMHFQLSVANARQLDTDPTGPANVWRFVVLLRRRFDQCLLDADGRRHDNCDVSIVMMIDGTHREHFLLNKESRLAVRELLKRLRQRETNPADTFDLLFALIGLWFFRYSFHQHGLFEQQRRTAAG